MEDDILEFLKTNAPDFLEYLNEREKLQVKTSTHKLEFQKGDIVRSGKDKCVGVIGVLKGKLRVYINSTEGKEVTLFHIGSGELCVLAASCILNSITFAFEIICEEDCSCLVIPTSLVARIQSENVYLEKFLLRETVYRFSDVIWTIEQLLFLSVEKRIGNYLHDQIVTNRNNVVKITHDEIAKNIGSAREVVSRTLKNFEKTGAIELRRGSIIVLDKNKLFTN